MNVFRKNVECFLRGGGMLRTIPQLLLRGKSLIFVVLACFVFSCTEELPDYPVPLDNPLLELIKLDAATDRSKLVFSWDGVAIEHSRGFEFSLYKVGENGLPIEVVGMEKEEVTGTSVERPQELNTRYKAVFNILGDKQNRSNGQRPLEMFWNNLPVELQTPAVSIDGETDATKLIISWPAVEGAKAFEFSLYILDRDGDEEGAEIVEVVGIENEVVAGTSVERPYASGAFYRIVLKALGNEALWPITLDGKPAERNWYKAEVIPNGTDLTEFFSAEPISGELEKTYVLDGSYTMTGNIELGTTPMAIRGMSKSSPAKLTISDGSFVNGGAAFKLENIDIDYTNFNDADGNLSNHAVILMSPEYAAGVELGIVGSGSTPNIFVVPVSSPIVLQSCKITGLKGYLFYDSNQSYAIGTFTIDNCIIGLNTNTFNQATIRGQISVIKNLTITNTTIYNQATPPVNSSNRFIQFNSSLRIPDVVPPAGRGEPWLDGGNLTISSCTFWQVGKGSQVFNSNGPLNRPQDTKVVTKTLFVECFENGRILDRLGANRDLSIGSNAQWYDGAAVTGTNDNQYECINTDPRLNYVGNGVFTMSGAEHIAARIGDPRWLQ